MYTCTGPLGVIGFVEALKAMGTRFGSGVDRFWQLVSISRSIGRAGGCVSGVRDVVLGASGTRWEQIGKDVARKGLLWHPFLHHVGSFCGCGDPKVSKKRSL